MLPGPRRRLKRSCVPAPQMNLGLRKGWHFEVCARCLTHPVSSLDWLFAVECQAPRSAFSFLCCSIAWRCKFKAGHPLCDDKKAHLASACSCPVPRNLRSSSAAQRTSVDNVSLANAWTFTTTAGISSGISLLYFLEQFLDSRSTLFGATREKQTLQGASCGSPRRP